MNIRWLTPVLGMLLAAPVIAADYDTTRRDDTTQVQTNREGKSPPASRKARKLAREFNQNPADVQALRDRGMGWGEIRQALWISQQSDRPVNEIVELRDSGMGWGEIAARYNLESAGPDGDKGAATVDQRDRELKDRRGRFGSDVRNSGREGQHIDRPTHIPPSQENPEVTPVPEPSVTPDRDAPADQPTTTP